jgi:hypothetical protein
VLANILRTDPGAHRPLPADSELACEIRVLARAHQDAIWDRQQTANKRRSLLREYYPAFLATFPDRTSREARAALALAPTQPRQPRCARPRCEPPWPAPGAAAASTLKPAGSWPGCGPASCASLRESSRPWAARPWPTSGHSMPPRPA